MDELQRLENLQRQLGNDALTGGAIGAAIGALVEGARYMKVVRETDDARRKELDERIEKLEKLASSASQVVMIPKSAQESKHAADPREQVGSDYQQRRQH